MSDCSQRALKRIIERACEEEKVSEDLEMKSDAFVSDGRIDGQLERRRRSRKVEGGEIDSERGREEAVRCD